MTTKGIKATHHLLKLKMATYKLFPVSRKLREVYLFPVLSINVRKFQVLSCSSRGLVMRPARGDDPGAQPSPLDLVIANGHHLKLESRTR